MGPGECGCHFFVLGDWSGNPGVGGSLACVQLCVCSVRRECLQETIEMVTLLRSGAAAEKVLPPFPIPHVYGSLRSSMAEGASVLYSLPDPLS